MADGFIQLPADSTGKQLDTVVVNMGVGTTSVHREKIVVADPLSTSAYAPVTSSAGLLTNLSSGTVTLSSAHVVSLSSGTVTLSSAHIVSLSSGTVTLSSNPTVVSASSGLVQISGIPAVTSTSVLLTTGSIISLSSGTVTLSSNPTVVSASSGLVQVSGTVVVASASSGLVQISGTPAVTSTFVFATPASTAGVVGPVTSSGGQTVSVAVNSAAGFGPVTSSYGQLVNQTTGSIPSVISATSANPTPVIITSSGAITPATVIASTISKVSSSAGALYSLQAFTTAATGAVLRLYNAGTSSVSMGASVLAYLLVGAQSTSAGWEENLLSASPRPLNFGTACSFDVVLTATSTATVAGNTFVTWQFV